MDNNLFRKKSIDKVSSPEKLDDYIRVTTPSVWITLVAILVVIVGASIWGIFGRITIHTADGLTETIAPISFIIN